MRWLFQVKEGVQFHLLAQNIKKWNKIEQRLTKRDY